MLRRSVVTDPRDLAETESFDGDPTNRAISARGIAIGTLLDGKYRVLAVKQGGMGRIYLVTGKGNASDEPRAALKSVIPYDQWRARRSESAECESEIAAHYAQLLERFRREAMNWVRLPDHPNIVSAVGVHEIGTTPYLFLEYADSGDLAEWVRADKLPVSVAADFALQICEGMTHVAKKAGLVHRDIKPSNILVHGKKQVKITDLGLARAFEPRESLESADRSLSDDLSAAGAGSLPYMAPEQVLSLRNADTRSDVFSFGVTFFEMLTGERLFSKSNAYVASRHQLVLPGAHDINDDVPPSLSKIISRCVAYEPKDRFGSFAELAEAIASTDLAKPDRTHRVKRSLQELPDEVDTRDWNREVFALLSLGQFKEAVELGRQAIKAEPTKSGHWLNLGKAYAELAQYPDAHRCYTKATELNPVNVECWFNVAYSLISLNRFPESLKAAEQAIRVDADCSQAWDAAGICHHELGRFQEARRCFHRAVDADKYNWRGWANLGRCLQDLGRQDEANAAFQKAIALRSQ